MVDMAFGSSQRSDEDVRNTIFIVQARRQTGTGFLALDRQHILTAAHVVAGMLPDQEKVLVQNARTKEPYSAVVQRLWENWDVALLRLEKPIEDRAIQPFNLSQQKPIAGSNFSTYGFPVDYGRGWFYGTMGNEEEDRKYTVNFMIVFDPATYGGTLEGLSGGPIFDMNNRSSVLGIICEHGPTNYQMGKVVPTAGFYKEIVDEIGTIVGETDRSSSEGIEVDTRRDWGEALDVDVFFGRTSELATLEQWILQDHCRLVAIVGMGGIGKTRLSVKLGKGGIGKTDLSLKLARGIQDQFDYIIWRRLLNAPQLTEILSDLIKFLSNQQEVDVADTVDEQVSNLLYYLRQHRCLLILDNVEMILQGGKQAGQYRPGYEDYGQLFSQIAAVPHRSCLILTSREKPPEIAKLESKRGSVRCLQLSGLSYIECKKIFAEVGSFSGSKEGWRELNRRYNGNPLALELAARHIKEVFSGNISQFLTEGTPIFTGLQELLAWHFDRLSSSQQEVMYWLAINREPQSVSELKEDILFPEAKEQIPSTLQLLQQLVPLDKGANGFTLQPVLMEYAIERFVKQITEEIKSGNFDLFNAHALLKASAKDYVRESQARLILRPIVQRLLATLEEQKLEKKLKSILSNLRNTQPQVGSYAAGNLLNLLIQLGFDLNGYDFSYLTVRQAYLQGKNLPGINFAHANLETSIFTDTFGSILSVAFSPNGRLLAAGTILGEVRVWQMPSGTLQLIYQGHIDWVWAVAFSSDGRLLISGGSDRTVRLWEVESGRCLKILRGHTSEVRSIALSPDGKIIASGSQDQTICFWDLSTGQYLKILQGHSGQVRTLALSPDSQMLASGSEDQTIRLWESSTGQCFRVLQGHTRMVRSIAFSPDGQVLASGSEDQTIRLWESSTGQCLKILQKDIGLIYKAIFSPDGHMLASIDEDQTIQLWEVSTGECLKILRRHANLAKSAIFSSEGAIAFSPDGRTLASGGEDQTLRLWDVSSGERLRTIQGYTNPVYASLFSLDGRLIASGSEDQTIHLWENNTTQYLRSLRGHLGPIWAIAFSSNTFLLASGSSDRTIRLWEVDSGQCLKTLQGHTDLVKSVAFSPDDRILVSGSEDLTIRLWEISTGQCFKILQEHTSTIWSVAFNRGGSIIASGSEDGTIRLWDASSGECLSILEGISSRIYSIAFSPDGSLLASGGEDQIIRIWDISSRQYLATFQGHTNRIRSIAYSPDGSLLASGSVDGTIRVWEASSGRNLKVIQGYNDIVWSIAFSPDGQVIVSSNNDGTTKLWDIQTGACLKVLRSVRPYEGMNITGVRGLTGTQKVSLKVLGAIEDEVHKLRGVTATIV